MLLMRGAPVMGGSTCVRVRARVGAAARFCSGAEEVRLPGGRSAVGSDLGAAIVVRPAVSGDGCAAAGSDSSDGAGVASSLSPPPSKVSGDGLPLLPLANGGQSPVPMASPGGGATASAIRCATGSVPEPATPPLRRRRISGAERWRGEGADNGVSEPVADVRRLRWR